jgi:ATP-dependent exoDNAse (exonuclease V) beta subunit
MPHSYSFERPEGSFAVRAFGNVVHRFLQFVSATLAAGDAPETLLADLPSWEPRILAALRNEGVAPAFSQREALRVRAALRNALEDPIGRWILSPHNSAASEHSIASLDSSVLRADRTFVSGDLPLAEGSDNIWIVDFKTTEPGSRSPERFAEDEQLKYRDQLERYASVLHELSPEPKRIVLGLYFPLIPRLVHWIPSETS